MLGYSKEYLKSQARAIMFYRDKDPTSTSTTDAGAFKERYDLTKGSATFELMFRPAVDIMQQEKFLAPSIDLQIQFDRAPPEFYLISPKKQSSSTTTTTEAAKPAKYAIEIQDARLQITKHTLYPSLMLSHIKKLDSGAVMQYPMRRVECKSMHIVSGTIQLNTESLISGMIPARILLTLVKATDQVGKLETNPFIFNHNNVSFVHVTVNNDQIITTPIEVDYSAGTFMEAYYNLFYGMGIVGEDLGVDLTLKEFKEYFCVYLFNLTQVKDAFTIPQYGSVRIEIKFKQAPSEALTLIALAEYPSVMTINSAKQVSFRNFAVE